MKKLIVILFPFIVSAQVDNTAVQTEFAKLINAYRIENGLTPLKTNADAQTAAKIQSDYLASTLRFENNSVKFIIGHKHPVFNSPSDRLAEVNPELSEHCGVGENAAMFLDDNAKLAAKLIAANVFKQWKESPAHNEAMLDDMYTHFGIAASVNSKTFPHVDTYYSFDIDYNLYASALVLLTAYY
jgi:uncharacterized protein YkwD